MDKWKVLVVEDDTPVRNLITVTLSAEDYSVFTAASGAEAVSEAASRNPDIILLDLGLPDRDGVEVIETIRSWADTPIIVISARDEDADKIGALDAGADDYITKPFSVAELLARLRATQRRLVHSAAGRSDPVFRNGALTIDYAAGCAWLDGEELKLTPIEYRLLCLLAQNVGKVLTLGDRLGEQHRLAPRVHGDAAQEAGKQPGVALVHPDPYRRRIPHDQGGLSSERR